MLRPIGFLRAIFCLIGALCCVLPGLIVVSSCSGDSFESTSKDAGVDGGCAGGQVSCGGQCVSADDPAFGCGSCSPCALDKAIPSCDGGKCVVQSCQPGFADCDQQGGCEVDLNSAENCGKCGQPCATGQVCDQGTCQASCSAGKLQCGSSCVDTQNDVQHCGGCANPCSTVANALSVCSLGVCGLACNPGFLNCDGKRETGCEVNSNFDPKHCSACGAACQPGELCTDGKCVLSCGGGTTECAGKCVDLQTDEGNCGDCGKACAAGQNCIGGECQLNCGLGTVACNGVCVDTKIDPNNCGACENACGAGFICTGSACVAKCATQTPTLLFSDDFADKSKGWSLESPWNIGAAKSSSGETYGGPDPATDATSTTDNGVAGVVIGGNVPIQVGEYVFMTSPAINTLAAATLFLSYSRWLNSDYDPFMKNVVQIFDGSQWVTIWETDISPGITDDTWVKQSFEITQYKNVSLRVRFGYMVGSTNAFTVSGWNVDDVKITGFTCG